MPNRHTPQSFWSYIDIKSENECWNYQLKKTKKGYGRVIYQGQNMYAHRLAYILTYGSISDGLMILHNCNNPACCNPKHLRPGTNRENMEDRTKAGRTARGERSGNSKLTSEQVLEIRKLYATGQYSTTKLGKMYNVADNNIWQIVVRNAWKHI